MDHTRLPDIADRSFILAGPEATFLRRAVSDTVMFTISQFGGESLAPFRADADGYGEMFGDPDDYRAAEALRRDRGADR